MGSIDPVNPVYIYKVEQIHAVDGIGDGDSHQPRSALGVQGLVRFVATFIHGNQVASSVNLIVDVNGITQRAYPSPGVDRVLMTAEFDQAVAMAERYVLDRLDHRTVFSRLAHFP